MHQPSLLITSKNWDEVLPQPVVQELLQATDGRQSSLILFYGDARDNKTAAAALVAAQLKKEAYRVDLSAVVSTYIGETEKNLNTIFDKAVNTQWILFFDEADALFGKRTDVQDSHDKYANQELSYLLQKIEKYKGTVLVATTTKTNIPAHILRRFHAVIPFPHKKPN